MEHIKHLLEKYEKGTASAEECEQLMLLMQEVEQEHGTDVPAEADELSLELWTRIKRSMGNRSLLHIVRHSIWVKLAAAIVLVGSAALIGVNMYKGIAPEISYHMVSAPVGHKIRVVLADSSVVWLNAGSQLKVPNHFNKDSRTVELEHGEAFFAIKSDARKPFSVLSSGITTQVLGTSFNIKNNAVHGTVQVTVKTGKVEIHDHRGSMGLYTQNQQLIYNKTDGQYSRTSLSNNNSDSWTKARQVLYNVSFAELRVHLEKRYGVHFKGSPGRSSVRYSLDLYDNMDLKDVLDILRSIDGVAYDVKGKEVRVAPARN